MRCAVYGATGFLGRLVVEQLTRRGVEVTIVGRRLEALQRSASSYPSARIAVAQIDDVAALKGALDGCAAVINCAPAAVCGDRLLYAALDAHAHYVDAAGEQHHIQRLFDAFGDEAGRRGIAIVPACGFDYAIGDCLAWIAARDCEPASEIVIAYCIEGADVSGNSAQNAASAPAAQEVVYRSGRWMPVPFELDRAAFDFPAPFGRRQMSRYGSGEVITVPRHSRTRAVRTLITTTSLCPHPALLPVFPILRPAIGLARRTPGARGLLRLAASLAARRGSPAVTAPAPSIAPIAPSPSADPGRRFVVAAEAKGQDGSTGRATAVGGDFHTTTAALLAYAAVSLGNGRAAGVFSPATAFQPGALLDALAPLGVTWSSDRQPRP
jgi:short subunit dehydrogenase-like uncharacterized protein